MDITVGPSFRLVYRSGNAHNPGDPVGAVTLTIDGAGAVLVDNVARGGLIERHFAGTTDRAVLERVLGHLREAGFPEVPPHRIPPGDALRQLRIESEGQSAQVPPTSWHGVASMPGYREAYHLLDSIVTLVSAGELKVVNAPAEGVATPAARLVDG